MVGFFQIGVFPKCIIIALISCYMLRLEDAASGNVVNYTGRSFKPVGGGWSGNYLVDTLWIQDNLGERHYHALG